MSRRHQEQKARRERPQARRDRAAPAADRLDAAPPSRGRLWAFRLLAVIGLPLLALLLLEGGLRLVGWGYPSRPTVRRVLHNRAVFERNLKFTWQFFPPNVAREASYHIITADKPANTCRIFVLGASAAMGIPATEYAFGRQLEVMLAEAYPQIGFEVINTAITAINSHVVLPIARDCARHHADFAIVYLGNNEVVGPYGPGTVIGGFQDNIDFIRFGIAVRRTRLGQLLAGLVRRGNLNDDQLQAWSGMEMFQRQPVRADAAELAAVYANFGRNLIDIREALAGGGGDLILCSVASNLRDCPPFVSAHRPDLAQTDQRVWQDAYDAGRAAEADQRFAEALAAYDAAAALDATYADLIFRRGRCLAALGRYDEARAAYVQARDADALRFRADSRINEIIRDVATEGAADNVLFFDGVACAAATDPCGLPGEQLFFEHVHFNFRGNHVIARGLAERIAPRLHARFGDAANAVAPLPDMERCAELLAYTPWDEHRVARTVLGSYLTKPPFTLQSYHDAQVARWEQRLADRAAALTDPARTRTVRMYETAIARRPDDWVLRHHYGNLLAAAFQDMRRAAEQYRQGLAAGDDYHLHVALGGALGNLGDYETARRHNRAALAKKPNCSKAHYNLGVLDERQGELDSALDHFRRAAEYDPEDPLAWIALCRLLGQQGRRTELEQAYRRALRFHEDVPDLHYNLALLLVQQNRRNEAVAEVSRALELEPDFAPAQDLMLRLTGRRQP